MGLSKSTIRRIIKEESKRVLEESYSESGPSDPVGILEMGMTHIEDLFGGRRDPDEIKDEASGLIEDICDHLKDSLHDWVLS
jgi:hypothetical protein